MGRISEKIITKSIDSLKEYENNDEVFGLPSKEEEEVLEISIREKGIIDPILITKDGKILSGHRRVNMAQKLGYKEVPCRIFYPDYPGEEVEIWLEANLTQRKLSPKAGYKAYEIYESCRIQKDLSSLKASLIPELAEALENGSLDVPLARALAKLPLEKQKDFIHLIGEKIKYVANVKLSKLEEILKETQKKLNQKIEEHKKLVKQIEEYKKLLAQYNKQNERLKAERKKVEEEKDKLISRIKQLEAEKEILLSRPEPSPDKDLEELDRKITNLKNQIWEKDQKLEELKALLEQTEEQARRLEEMLSKERAEKERLKAEMTSRIQEEVKKVREEQKRQQTFSPDNIPKGLDVALLARRLTEWLNTLLTETWATGDQFDPEAKKFTLDALEELSLAIELAKEKLKGKDILFEEMKKLDPEVF